eukprot:NODE_198_length_13236_cov_1.328385.p5 type:complete len:319 gc:universal NODE_198_length_13236_cov_1.328385:8226-7270(-)
MTKENKHKTFNDNVHYLYSTFGYSEINEEDGLDFTLAATAKDIFMGTILESENKLIRFDHKLKEKDRIDIEGEVTVIYLDKEILTVGTSTGVVYHGEYKSLKEIAKFGDEITSISPYQGGFAISFTAGVAIVKDSNVTWQVEQSSCALDVFDDSLIFVMDNNEDANVCIYNEKSTSCLYKIPLIGEAKSISIHKSHPYALFATSSKVELHDLRSGMKAQWVADEQETFERLKWNPFAKTQFFLSVGNQIHLIDIAKMDSEFVDEDCDFTPEFISTHVAFDNNVSDLAIFPVRGKEKFGVIAVDSEQIQRYVIHPELLE